MHTLIVWLSVYIWAGMDTFDYVLEKIQNEI